MKKIISLLVVLAMLMAMAPAVFAASESGNLMVGAGATQEWVAPATGTVTISTETGSNVAVDGGNTFMGFSGSFDAVEGQTYVFQHFGSSFEIIYWSLESGSADPNATTGTVEIESYSYGEWTAPKDGFVKITFSSETEAEVVVSNSLYCSIASGDTIEVTAGTKYSFYPFMSTVNSVMTWEYVDGDSGNGGGSSNQPAGNTLVLGDNNVVLEAGDADGETLSFTATESGNLSIEITTFAYDEGFGMGMQEVPAQYIGMVFRNFVFEVNGVQAFEPAATIPVNAGDEVTVVFASPMMRYAAEIVLTLSMGSSDSGNEGGETGEDLNAQYQGSGTFDEPFIIEELPANLGITMTMIANDFYFQYTATEAGVISFNELPANVSVWPIQNGNMIFNSDPIQVEAGETVILNIFGGNGNVYVPVEFEAGATLPEGDEGDDTEQGGEPDGSMDNPFVIESMPFTVSFYGGMDLYYVYNVPADGVITANQIEGALLSSSHDYELIDDVYHYTVVAGDLITLNPWTMEAEISGDMTFNFVADGSDAPLSGTDVEIAADETLEIIYTPTEDGTLTIDVSGTPGHSVLVQEVVSQETIGLPSQSSTAETLTFELTAGVAYKITFTGFDALTWDVADATISYDITFDTSSQSTPVEIDAADVELILGEQTATLLENTTVTLFNFVPAEAGIYKFTVPAGVTMAEYGFAWNLIKSAENGVLEIEVTAAEQTIIIGLTAETETVAVTIERTGDYVAPESVNKQEYKPTVEVDTKFEMPSGTVSSVDITKPQSIVLGNDGYYHLGTYNGPILYVNLNSDEFVLANIKNGSAAPTQFLGQQYTGADNKLYVYDYLPMMSGAYYELSRIDDYYPLNDDLMTFIKDYGAAQGWFTKGLSPIDAVNDETANKDSAWMFFLSYIEGNNGTATAPADAPESTTPKTGDFGVIAAAVAMAVSAISGTALVVKKKEF